MPLHRSCSGLPQFLRSSASLCTTTTSRSPHSSLGACMCSTTLSEHVASELLVSSLTVQAHTPCTVLPLSLTAIALPAKRLFHFVVFSPRGKTAVGVKVLYRPISINSFTHLAPLPQVPPSYQHTSPSWTFTYNTIHTTNSINIHTHHRHTTTPQATFFFFFFYPKYPHFALFFQKQSIGHELISLFKFCHVFSMIHFYSSQLFLFTSFSQIFANETLAFGFSLSTIQQVVASKFSRYSGRYPILQ